MVLIVISHIKCDQIETAIVGIGLEALDEHIVLGDEVSRNGMEPESEKSADEQIEERLEAERVEDERVERDLYERVDDLEESDLLGHDDDGTKWVEEWQ